MEYILEMFLEVHLERDEDTLGRPKRLSSEKLEAWSRLHRLTLSAFELEAIRRLDALFMSQKFDKEE